MSDEGEKTCPLCAEEMDLTDQQLKPCRCGYEICVWCWHHIMEMAEKDETEGRCPACRTPYDKEKIVGTAANCGRMVTDVSVEKKLKSQKAKTKSTESRKQLTSVRVIQRNLVYIVGLPLDLADEDLLLRKEYFGQYGKVLKVSISRTSAGTIQQFANNTCSVYITYAREDEAVRCIQSVHAFILDGRPLRACFGTTKYCHAWLRNVPCSNPDCLYLHEIGSQEDSFTKDEFISAYSRVQQITGVTNNMQRRSGTILPPPADDYCVSSSTVTGKPIVKYSNNSSANSTKGSPPTSSSGRPAALPPAASWGARASNCSASAASLACSDGLTKQKAEIINGPHVVATSIFGNSQISMLPDDSGKRPVLNDDIHARQSKSKLEISDSVKQQVQMNSHLNGPVASSTPLAASVMKPTGQTALAVDSNSDDTLLLKTAIADPPCSPCEDERGWSTKDGNIQKEGGVSSAMSNDKQLSGDVRANGMALDIFPSPRNQDVQWHESDELQEELVSAAASSSTGSGEGPKLDLDVPAPSLMQNLMSVTEDDFDSQRLGDTIINQGVMPASSSLHILSHLRVPLQPYADSDCTGNYTGNHPIVNRIPDELVAVNLPTSCVASNGFLEHFVNRAPGQESCLLNGGQRNFLGSDGELSSFDSQPPLDVGENHIISNILSLDLDSWDDSLTSPQTLSKLFGEPDKQEGLVKSTNAWRGQLSNQSRFSFARQEESRNHVFDAEPSLGSVDHTANSPSFGQVSFENRDLYLERHGNGFGFPQRNMELSDNYVGGHSGFPTSKLSVSRSQISAPPGFSVPSRPPPPGFTSHERSDQPFDFLKSGSQFQEASPYVRNSYQASPSGNMNVANDIEFMDPAILAVGKGRLPSGGNSPSVDMRSQFHVRAPGFENDSRLQLLMQRSLSPHQNLRYSERDNFSPPNDTYSFNNRHMEQAQANNLSPFSQFSLQQSRTAALSNGHWDGWNDIQSPNNLDIGDLLRNDRVGFNKFLAGYEDSKFRMTNSGDLYNRSFGM